MKGGIHVNQITAGGCCCLLPCCGSGAGSMSQFFLIEDGAAGRALFIAIRIRKEHTQKMKMDERVYRELFTELEGYEKRGVDMSIDGYRASPLEIVTAHMTREEGTYMRDYVLSRDGNIQALRFTDIHPYGREQNTP